MTVAQWLISHIADFTDLEKHGAAMVADFPSTRGHGEIIAWALRHTADLSAIQPDIQKILADFPSGQPLFAMAPEAAKDAIVKEASLSNTPLSLIVSALCAAETLLPLIPQLSPYAATIKTVIDLLIGEIGG